MQVIRHIAPPNSGHTPYGPSKIVIIGFLKLKIVVIRRRTAYDLDYTPECKVMVAVQISLLLCSVDSVSSGVVLKKIVVIRSHMVLDRGGGGGCKSIIFLSRGSSLVVH